MTPTILFSYKNVESTVIDPLKVAYSPIE